NLSTMTSAVRFPHRRASGMPSGNFEDFPDGSAINRKCVTRLFALNPDLPCATRRIINGLRRHAIMKGLRNIDKDNGVANFQRPGTQFIANIIYISTCAMAAAV